MRATTVRTATAVRTPARAKTSDAATLDMHIGPGDGVTEFKRCDVSVTRASDGRLRVEIEIPPSIGQQVASLLVALGVKGQR
jgi:hypothetical protein